MNTVEYEELKRLVSPKWKISREEPGRALDW